MLLEGHSGGVTQIKFSPDTNLLYSGARKVLHHFLCACPSVRYFTYRVLLAYAISIWFILALYTYLLLYITVLLYTFAISV